MESFTVCSFGLGGGRFLHRSSSLQTRSSATGTVSFRRPAAAASFRVLASNGSESRQLDKWDQMELKFGKLLGEDPKLTLAKIMMRKSNPDISYLEVEKQFREGKLDESLLRPPQPPKVSSDVQLNLPRRPVMKKGFSSGPSPGMGRSLIPRPTQQVEAKRPENASKMSQVTNVSLRKPVSLQADDDELESRMRVKPNLFLKMRKNSTEDLADVALLKKPEIEKISLSTDNDNVTSDDTVSVDDITLSSNMENFKELQPTKQNSAEPNDTIIQLSDDTDTLTQAALLGRPQRPESPTKAISYHTKKENPDLSNDTHGCNTEVDQILSEDQKDCEDKDWRKVETLLQTGEKVEVEVISCSSRGFVVSFGSLIGFLPYRNLGSKWKFLAFESWLRRKGLDPLVYKKNLNTLGSYDAKNTMPGNSDNDNQKDKQPSSEAFKFEVLLEAYDQEKIKFLSSFVGQRLKVGTILADRKLRRLIFSGRPREKEEIVEKKRNLMKMFSVHRPSKEGHFFPAALREAKLSIGDVVKCHVTKITYFGIFVEVEGVPALIHQSEVSWDATLDPSSYYKIGQVVDAKVHQLDYALERITLSLKEITPDPLMEALESVVGERTSLGGSLEAAQADVEWLEVESLVKELQQVDGIDDVSRGRFFLSLGLAPTFQVGFSIEVYMASMFDNKYKLLARYGNKVQEVIVQSTLDKEQMKKAISTSTNKVM